MTRWAHMPERLLSIVTGATLLLGVGQVWFGVVHWHDSQRILQCMLLALVAAACIGAPALRDRLLRQAGLFGMPACIAALAGLALGTLSALASGFARFGLLEVALVPPLLLVSLCLMGARIGREADFDRTALAVTGIVATILVTQFTGAYAAMLFAGVGFYPENLYRGGFSNPRFLGQFHTMALPLLVAACIHPGLSRRWRGILAAVLVMSLVMALLTASRATWYAWSAATVGVLVVCRAHARVIAGVQLAAIAAAGGIFWLMFMLPAHLVEGWDFNAVDASFGRLGDPTSLSLREVLWWRAWELIGEHPILGIGPMGAAVDFNPVASHPHNALLQVASEWGLPAALMLCIGLALAGLRLARGLWLVHGQSLAGGRAEAGADSVLAPALAISLLGIAIHAMADGVAVMPYTQVALAAVFGWAASVLLPRDSGMPPRASARALGIAVPGLALAALLHGVLPESTYLESREEAFALRHSSAAAMMPRFWAQGWVVDEVDRDAVRFDARYPP